jgi:hypothetical protein
VSTAVIGVRGRGEAILQGLALRPIREPALLAAAIVPAEPGPFRERLRDGLATLLAAVAGRSPALATAAACRLVGVGPGSTPLGDDYIAACGLTIATFGERAGLDRPARAAWLASLFPPRLAQVTTPASAAMIAGAVSGIVPEPVRGLYSLDLVIPLATRIARVTTIGASSGHAWAASIGATAMLLAPAPETDDDNRPGGSRG